MVEKGYNKTGVSEGGRNHALLKRITKRSLTEEFEAVEFEASYLER